MEQIRIDEMEHYILHAISELNSKRNDGWVDGHYRDELLSFEKKIDQYLKDLENMIENEETIDWVKGYEKEKLLELKKRINGIN